MEGVQLKQNENGEGTFYIMEGKKQVGELVVGIEGKILTAYHTEVSPEAEGKGLAKQLVAAMAEYAKENQLQVIPRCSYVHAQFKRHPQEYNDLWKKEE